jgi:hypothetical protein
VSRSVGPGDRRRDLAALALVLVGAAIMLSSHFGMRDLAALRVTLAEGEYYMNRYNTYQSRSVVGAGFIAAGVIVGLWALVRHKTDRHRESLSAEGSDTQASG